jgi:hypothetical protein
MTRRSGAVRVRSGVYISARINGNALGLATNRLLQVRSEITDGTDRLIAEHARRNEGKRESRQQNSNAS